MLKKWFGSLLFFLVYHICTSKGFVTVRNEVAKVMFLHVSVCPRGGLPQCMLGCHHREEAHPPLQQIPPWSRHPPGSRLPPPKQMATVADGTHPTGMHSCLKGVQILQTGSKINKYLLDICSEFFLFVRIRVSASMSEGKVRAGQ